VRGLRTALLVTAALAAVGAGAGCGSNEKAEEFEDVTLEEADDPVRSAFEEGLRTAAEEDGDLTDTEITCVVSGTRDEIDDQELTAAAQAQLNEPGAEISDDLNQDVEKIADDCGVEFEAP
jgi:hypothetical protein